MAVEVLGVVVAVAAKEVRCRWTMADMTRRQRWPASIREYLSVLQVRTELIAIAQAMGTMRMGIGTITVTGTGMGMRRGQRYSSVRDCDYHGASVEAEGLFVQVMEMRRRRLEK